MIIFFIKCIPKDMYLMLLIVRRKFQPLLPHKVCRKYGLSWMPHDVWCRVKMDRHGNVCPFWRDITPGLKINFPYRSVCYCYHFRLNITQHHFICKFICQFMKYSNPFQLSFISHPFEFLKLGYYRHWRNFSTQSYKEENLHWIAIQNVVWLFLTVLWSQDENIP